MTIQPDEIKDLFNEDDEAIADIAYTIAAEVATEWGLWLYEPETALRVWTGIAQYAITQARNAATELHPETNETAN